jgi:hypothetical protein
VPNTLLRGGELDGICRCVAFGDLEAGWGRCGETRLTMVRRTADPSPSPGHPLKRAVALRLFSGIGTGGFGCGLLKDLLHYELRCDLLAGE